MPHCLFGWVEDLGNPDVTGGNVHRGGEDGRNGEEDGSQSGREFHGYWVGFVRGGRKWWEMVGWESWGGTGAVFVLFCWRPDNTGSFRARPL